MCVYSAKKERNNNVGKTIVLTISYKEEKGEKEKKKI
jgi:hypothetical protein